MHSEAVLARKVRKASNAARRRYVCKKSAAVIDFQKLEQVLLIQKNPQRQK
jgi:hypothetical protein